MPNRKFKPPFFSAQLSQSRASSTQIIEGAFIVLPSKIPLIILLLFAILKTLGIGHDGYHDFKKSI